MISLNKKRKVPADTYEEAKVKNLIDEECIPLCDFFNSIGFKTTFSCQGHKPGEPFMIHFEPSLADTEVFALLKVVEEANGHGPRGKFSKWHRQIHGNLVTSWMYVSSGTRKEIEDDIAIDLKRFEKAMAHVQELSQRDDNLYV